MILNSTPVLATSAKAFARSLLFSLGVDQVLADFLANIAIGAATAVALKVPSWRFAARLSKPRRGCPTLLAPLREGGDFDSGEGWTLLSANSQQQN